MKRNLFEDEHEAYRGTVAAFIAKEVSPNYETWCRDGIVPRELFAKGGELGMFPAVPEEYGGSGVTDFRFNVVLSEEAAKAAVTPALGGFTLHNEICMPYFLELTTEEQKQRWLPGIAAGTLITAVAMTEPGTGSDLSGISTKAVRDGDHYVVSGAKTFITNGINSDLVIVVTRTGDDPHRGLTLLVLERGMEGFTRGRNLDKVGQHAQDTAELFFDDVRVPASNMLGSEGEGFYLLMRNLAQERLGLAVSSLASAQAAFSWTCDYVRERHAFGKAIGSFQNTRFKLAEMATELDIAQTYVDAQVLELNEGTLDAVDAAKSKMWVTEMQGRVIDACVQLHGGYGYMLEYPIAQAYIDSRISRIYGGTNEIMREIIGRSLNLNS